jgi:hypothetical protein
MALDISKLDSVVEVQYSDDESYNIKFITDEQLRLAISRSGVSWQEFVENPDDKIIIDLLEESLVGWKGITANGTALECNAKNKQLILKNFSNRAIFLFAKCRDEQLFFGAKLEKDLKN